MTRPYRRRAKSDCGRAYPLNDACLEWIRTNPEPDSGIRLSFMDRDVVCHRFKTTHGRSFQCMMFLEIKTCGATLGGRKGTRGAFLT